VQGLSLPTQSEAPDRGLRFVWSFLILHNKLAPLLGEEKEPEKALSACAGNTSHIFKLLRRF